MQERLRFREESAAIGVTFPQEFLPIAEEAIKRLRDCAMHLIGSWSYSNGQWTPTTAMEEREKDSSQ